jgi:hypothetical protein
MKDPLGLAVVAIGCIGIYFAIRGKPRRRVFGLTERLIHRLPGPYYRVVMLLIGLVIISVGLAAAF